ncbi:MAG: Rieske 2Fe-2S domain-containing protein [Flavobacteriales bacterium]|nr:Rieske 2Fe-2S domain-containing protein [Flavobacteriales bacterium]
MPTLKCSWHGSRFSLNGSVVTGPASAPLKSYRHAGRHCGEG